MKRKWWHGKVAREDITVDLLTANEQPKLQVLLDNKNDVCLNGNRIRLISGAGSDPGIIIVNN